MVHSVAGISGELGRSSREQRPFPLRRCRNGRTVRLLLRELDSVPQNANDAASPGLGSIGAMRDDAELLDQIVEHAMKVREERPWRLTPLNKALLDTDIYSEILKGMTKTSSATRPPIARPLAASRSLSSR